MCCGIFDDGGLDLLLQKGGCLYLNDSLRNQTPYEVLHKNFVIEKASGVKVL